MEYLPVVPIIDTEGPTTGQGTPAELFSTWKELGAAVKELHENVRPALRDSFGNPLVISWFVMDWSHYSLEDAAFKRRGHAHRLHEVWDFYFTGILNEENRARTSDGLYWHYHHPDKDGGWQWNKDWTTALSYEDLLGKLILDYEYFPALYRAGKYVENNLNSAWLEKWIPFDYSSIAPVKRDFCDWSASPTDWVPYHPDTSDYQKPGGMKRTIARSVPFAAKGGSGNLEQKEIERAFASLKEGKRAIFSFHTHDYYKSMTAEFREAHMMIDAASKKAGIPWRYENALTALQHGLQQLPPLRISIKKIEIDRVAIRVNHDLIGEMPFVVAEDHRSLVHRVDVDRETDGSFILHVPRFIKRVGVAGSDLYGNTAARSIVISS